MVLRTLPHLHNVRTPDAFLANMSRLYHADEDHDVVSIYTHIFDTSNPGVALGRSDISSIQLDYNEVCSSSTNCHTAKNLNVLQTLIRFCKEGSTLQNCALILLFVLTLWYVPTDSTRSRKGKRASPNCVRLLCLPHCGYRYILVDPQSSAVSQCL